MVKFPVPDKTPDKVKELLPFTWKVSVPFNAIFCPNETKGPCPIMMSFVSVKPDKPGERIVLLLFIKDPLANM